MLAGLAGLVSVLCGGCTIDEQGPTLPSRLTPEVVVTQQVSDGCTRFALKVVNSVPTVEALYNTNKCKSDELQLLADSVPTFDTATGTLRVPVVMKNLGTVSVVAPARIRFVADSSQFLNAQGQVIAGTPDIVATNYDSASANGRSGQWRYDQVLAAGGQPQVLMPNGVSTRRWLEFAGTTWSQTIRIKLPTAATQVGGVPAIPPDSTPAFARDSTNIVFSPSDGGMIFVRRLLLVQFQPSSSVTERSNALALIGGVVVGGVRSSTPSSGLYMVEIPAVVGADDVATIAAAESVLRAHPAVRVAVRYAFAPPSTSYVRPIDGAGWQRADWEISPVPALAPAAWRGSWGLSAVRSPLAWGCSTGDAGIRVGVLDLAFSISSGSDLAPNVVRTTNGNLPGDTAVKHGTWVASVLGARGDNQVGITGMMWRVALDLYDPTELDSFGSALYRLGKRSVPYQGLARGFIALDSAGARAINISLGADTLPVVHLTNPAEMITARQYISYFANEVNVVPSDPLVVVSAGNVNQGDPRESFWPILKDSASTRVLVVAAMRRDGSLRNGPSGSAYIDIVAPGDSIGTLNPGNVIIQASGASIAAPIVSGLVGLLRSFDPRLTAAETRQLILDGALQGGRTSGGYPVLDAYESLRLAAQRPGAPLCGNLLRFVATVDTINSQTTTGIDAKRTSGTGGFERIATVTVPGLFAVPIAAPHGGKELLLEESGNVFRRVAVQNGTGWQTLAPPWTSVASPSLTGAYYSRHGYSHDADSSLVVSGSWNAGFQSANFSAAVRVNGTTSAPLSTFTNVQDRWYHPSLPGGGPAGGAAGLYGTMSPTGGFAVLVRHGGDRLSTYGFYRMDLPSGATTLLFEDGAVPLVYGTSGSIPGGGPSLWPLAISEDGTELSYLIPGNSSYFDLLNPTCLLKRYSLTQQAMVTVDTIPATSLADACSTGGTYGPAARRGMPTITAFGGEPSATGAPRSGRLTPRWMVDRRRP